MQVVNQRRRKASEQKLKAIFEHPLTAWTIHYSCESFYDREDGSSPRITSIAVRNLDTGQTTSFSIHMLGERAGYSLDDIEEHYDQLETKMLEEFFAFLRRHERDTLIHWNMRDANYGFAAIDHRARVLKVDPFVVSDDRKVDLSRLLSDAYGANYAGHPRLPSLIELNELEPKDMMSGKEEAEAFEAKNYVGLHQSTLRKVTILSHIASKARDGALKTETSWWERYGGWFESIGRFIQEHWSVAIILFVVAIAGILIAIVSLF